MTATWKSRLTGLTVVLCAILVGQTRADLYTHSFVGITNNKPGSTAIGESQLTLGVSPGDTTDSVRFTFRNIGKEACSITHVFFEQSILLDMDGLTGSDGVSFAECTNKNKPDNFPGGNALTPKFEEWVCVSAKNPAPKKGVNPDEWLTVEFLLQKGKTFADVVSALSHGLAGTGSDGLRIGIHVQAFAGGSSESFINGSHAPLPGAVLLGMLGLGFASHRLRRHRRA